MLADPAVGDERHVELDTSDAIASQLAAPAFCLFCSRVCPGRRAPPRPPPAAAGRARGSRARPYSRSRRTGTSRLFASRARARPSCPARRAGTRRTALLRDARGSKLRSTASTACCTRRAACSTVAGSWPANCAKTGRSSGCGSVPAGTPHCRRSAAGNIGGSTVDAELSHRHAERQLGLVDHRRRDEARRAERAPPGAGVDAHQPAGVDQRSLRAASPRRVSATATSDRAASPARRCAVPPPPRFSK